MAIKYRVDRSLSPSSVPLGMNSIRYFGTNFKEAKRVYDALKPGKNSWDQPNDAYGVILSIYNTVNYTDVIKCSKGF